MLRSPVHLVDYGSGAISASVVGDKPVAVRGRMPRALGRKIKEAWSEAVYESRKHFKFTIQYAARVY